MYVLIECIEREIEGIRFDTYEEAYQAMKEAYESYDNFDESEITQWYAWGNDGPNHDNFDWKILKL